MNTGINLTGERHAVLASLVRLRENGIPFIQRGTYGGDPWTFSSRQIIELFDHDLDPSVMSSAPLRVRERDLPVIKILVTCHHDASCGGDIYWSRPSCKT